MLRSCKNRDALLSAAMTACLLAGTTVYSQVGPAAAPKFLFDPNPQHSEGKIDRVNPTVTATSESGGINVVIKGSNEGYPGFSIVPAKGKSWDLSPWGHVQAKVTNTGEGNLRLHMRVDNEGPWQDNPWNTEAISLKPGETKFLKVIFGHHYGFKPGYKLKPEAVVQVLFFGDKSDKDRTFRLEDVLAGGPAGEKPPVDPASIVVRPEGGIIIGEGAKLDPAPKIEAKDATASKKGAGIDVEVPADKQGSVVVRPAAGVWHLGNHHEVKVTIKNTGNAPVQPKARVESRSKNFSDTISAPSPVAPGASTTITVPFAPEKPWTGDPNPKQKHNQGLKGTGTPYESDRTIGVEVIFPKSGQESRVSISSVIASATPAVLPDWVGKRPPVEGDWTLTFEDNFDGDTINLQKWNIYTSNFWDKRTHFTKENNIVKDGKLILRYEKKTGLHNDDPEDKSPVAKTDFACGFADTYGKFTQRYGYFEARMKLPTCPGLWPAFWTMPDRGGDPDHKVNPQWKRASTHSGGMEFDIMEHLTAWGPYRFNSAFHWDGYDKDHKAMGTSNIYVPTDKDGFFTIGMLWLPGFAAYYGNGKEFARWESERICNVQSYVILYMVSGGWANVPLDPSQLPADFVIDYVRVWQRKDLASPEDGLKPNDGRPKSQF